MVSYLIRCIAITYWIFKSLWLFYMPVQKKSGNLLNAPPTVYPFIQLSINENLYLSFIYTHISCEPTHRHIYVCVCRHLDFMCIPMRWGFPVSWGCRIHQQHFCREVRPPTQWVSWIWHKTIWWWGSGNPEALGNAEYSFITIAPRSTLMLEWSHQLGSYLWVK